jgi:hypothetical protein
MSTLHHAVTVCQYTQSGALQLYCRALQRVTTVRQRFLKLFESLAYDTVALTCYSITSEQDNNSPCATSAVC